MSEVFEHWNGKMEDWPNTDISKHIKRQAWFRMNKDKPAEECPFPSPSAKFLATYKDQREIA